MQPFYYIIMQQLLQPVSRVTQSFSKDQPSKKKGQQEMTLHQQVIRRSERQLHWL
jgi:hypothetical protein